MVAKPGQAIGLGSESLSLSQRYWIWPWVSLSLSHSASVVRRFGNTMSETEDEKLLKEAKELPWDVRLFHKNWKVRNDANVDLAALCNSITDPEDPRLREFGLFFKNTVADSNPSVQERALDALIAYLKVADADSVERYAKEVCDVIAAKCLTGRPKTVEKLQMVFMLLIELESVDVVLDAMEKAIIKKVAKAVVTAIDIILQALRDFGAKIVPPKRIVKLLPELFDHRDQNVRASSRGLTLELCRWIGKETVKSVLFEKMPNAMKKELEAGLVSVSGIARSSRKISCRNRLLGAPSLLTARSNKAAKWSEQKVFVAKRIKLNSQLCIAPDYSAEIRQSLKKCLNDETPEVRDAAFASLEEMAKWVGAGPSEELLEKLDDVRWKNLPEMNDYSGCPVSTSSESYTSHDVPVTFQNSGRRNHNKLGLNLASIRILNELKLLRKDPLMNCSADQVSENIFPWKARIMGDPDSPYAGGEFLVDIHFPLNYPFVPPKVAFETKVFHPNIDITGDIYLGILEQWNWSPAVTMTEVLRSICTLLTNPDPAYFFVPKIAEMYNTDRSKYEKTARSWTLMYAMG